MAFGDGVHDLIMVIFILIIAVSIHGLINYLKYSQNLFFKYEELYLFFLFGPLLVSLTYYLQSYEMNFAIILSGIPAGMIAASNSMIANFRNAEMDKRCVILTQKITYSESFIKSTYIYLIILVSLMPVMIFMLINDHAGILACSVISIFAIRNIKRLLINPGSDDLLDIQIYNNKLLIGFTFLFAIGWIF